MQSLDWVRWLIQIICPVFQRDMKNEESFISSSLNVLNQKDFTLPWCQIFEKVTYERECLNIDVLSNADNLRLSIILPGATSLLEKETLDSLPPQRTFSIYFFLKEEKKKNITWFQEDRDPHPNKPKPKLKFWHTCK